MNKKLLVSYAVIIAILIILWLSFPEKPKLLGVCSSVLGLIGLYLNYCWRLLECIGSNRVVFELLGRKKELNKSW